MTLQKNGYRSEKRNSFATAVKILTLIFGIGVVIAAVCVYAIFSGCGGGGLDNGGSPMYDENGVCVNCNGDGWVMSEDGYIQQGHDSVPTYADGKPIPQPDTTPYVCPVSDPPEMCMPKEALQGECGNMGDGPKCYFGFMAGKPCTSDAECKKVPLDAYPPCVCWGLPCQLVGKWNCGESSIRDYTDIEFYDNGDGYCRIHTQTGGDLYFKPGDDHFQFPPSGPFEVKCTFLDGGNQLLGQSSSAGGNQYTCTKLVEE